MSKTKEDTGSAGPELRGAQRLHQWGAGKGMRRVHVKQEEGQSQRGWRWGAHGLAFINKLGISILENIHMGLFQPH